MMVVRRKIGEIAAVKGGKRLPKGKSVLDEETAHPYIRVVDLSDGTVDRTGLKFLDDTTFESIRRYTISSDDVYVSIAGTIGRVGIVPADLSGANLTENAAKITNISEEVDQRYLMYFLRGPIGQAEIANRKGGTSQPKLALYKVADIPFPCPQLGLQKRIASVLSVYDDLTENNRRRIQLLEESARLLYKEWFVDLRFPGHEHIKVIDGVPDGWERRELSELCPGKGGIQTGPFGSQLHQSDYTDEGVPVVMPQDLKALRISVEKIARIPEFLADKLARHRLEPGDTIYGRRGDIGRRALVTQRQAGYLCGTGCLRLRPDGTLVNPTYLYYALGTNETEGNIRNRAKGSTMPNLSAQVMKSVPVTVPTAVLQDEFADFAGATTEQIENLVLSSNAATSASDLLLPRLMNGELAV